MYAENQLGAMDSSAVISQTGSMVASFAAKSAASYLVTVMGFSSMAGPVGMVVGAIVSVLMAIFGGGKEPKKPVFGIVALIPDEDNEKITVGRLLSLLGKRMIDFGFGWGMTPTQAEPKGRTIAAHINSEPIGVLAITSGGLPTAHTEVSKLDFEKIRTNTAGLARPFLDMLNAITDSEIKARILATPLPYQSSSSYYFQMREERPGKEAPANSSSIWVKLGISQRFDAVKIIGGQALGGSLDRGLKSMPENINNVFIAQAGVDVMSGIVVDTVKADKAFNPSATDSLVNVASSPIGMLALLGIGFLIVRRR